MEEENNMNKYWENYAEYWVKRLRENKESNDKTPTDEITNRYLNILLELCEEKILDFGCGFCRTYKYIKENYKDKVYYGTDIAQKPLDNAILQMAELKDMLRITDGLIIPWEDNFFDGIFAWGVFDCTEQEKILHEFLRVVKENGYVCFTSKAQNYCIDDELAYIAEIKADEKGFPNHFTNYEKMRTMLLERNVEIVKEIFWVYRNEFGEDLVRTEKKPDEFYEYCLIIKKKSDTILSPFDRFCDSHSQTYYKIRKK